MAKEPIFNYVVARPWNMDKPEGSLCVYTYGGEVQQGTYAQAKEFLSYVKRTSKADRDPVAEQNAWGIYVVGYTRLPA